MIYYDIYVYIYESIVYDVFLYATHIYISFPRNASEDGRISCNSCSKWGRKRVSRILSRRCRHEML